MSFKHSARGSRSGHALVNTPNTTLSFSQPTLESIIAEAKTHYAQGNLAQARDLCEQILFADPNHLEGLHVSSLVCLARSDYPQAIERLTRAIAIQPNQSVFVMNLGIALMGMQRWADAFDCFTKLVSMRPENFQAHCHLGRVLLHQKKESEAALTLQDALKLNPEHAPAHELMGIVLRNMRLLPLAHYHQRLDAYYSKRAPDTKEVTPQHTLFVDREKARHTAFQNNMVPETQQASGLQLCFYFGEPFPDAPSNLVKIPATPEEFVAFFSAMTFSDPTQVDFNPDSQQERALAGRLAKLLNDARILRCAEGKQWFERCQQTRPEFGTGERLRVFLPTARQLDVMKYNARDLAKTLRRLGCETLYYVEEDNRHTFDLIHYYKTQAQFNPHIIIDINDYFKLPLHPETFKVAWFQDPMPIFMDGAYPWRERDLICSTNRGYDTFLYQAGVKNVRRQSFCYDEEVFQDFGQQRKRKVVVVASAHAFVFGRFPEAAPLLARMEEMFMAGEAMTETSLDQLAAAYHHDRDDIYYHLWSYVVRVHSVRWLCELSDELGIEVEVYGHQWEKDAVVRPFHKGPLPHGPAVSAVYNEALYVLISQQGLFSQRLVEVGACGAIPVIYDCRYRGEPFDHDHRCLWYRTKADMRNCLTQIPTASPHPIAEGSSFTDFARWILAEVEAYLAGT